MKLLSLILPVVFSVSAMAEMPRFIAHRGASSEAPENTLSAFRLALEQGADGIEGDFRLTSDGEIVCMHDADTKRTADKNLVIANSTYAELAKLDAGSWKSPRFAGEKIPKLGEVLDVLPQGKFFFLEIKTGPAIVDPIRRLLLEKKADTAHVIIICFDPAVIATCREKLPEFQAHLVSSLKDVDQPDKAAAYRKQFEDCKAQGFQFDCRAPVSGEWLKSLGVPLDSWTVDDAATARKVMALGVSFITSNRPSALRRELE
ncbi:hypothetical protein KBB96_11990 [Luteolibacter ambystomatis]|uniref:GP-PDE domain-containing protein n=1 Tax=Luteolibacter ambystomatis TaxID=2824561 RepID=A0A975G5Z7_9BACT|nr:glycerophosphodiester phosphodiesterase family protein [Luteolibacter ambystomatis]QUE49593.1 hypothetical protein KBB96_11990 [Luteolibacter ambystomatis]